MNIHGSEPLSGLTRPDLALSPYLNSYRWPGEDFLMLSPGLDFLGLWLLWTGEDGDDEGADDDEKVEEGHDEEVEDDDEGVEDVNERVTDDAEGVHVDEEVEDDDDEREGHDNDGKYDGRESYHGDLGGVDEE